MDHAQRSVLCFGTYLDLVGIGLLLAPDLLLAPLGFAPSADFWIRVVGVPVLVLRDGTQWQAVVGLGLSQAPGSASLVVRRPGEAALLGNFCSMARPSRTWARYSLPSVVSEKSARPNSLVPRICSSCLMR